MYLKIEPFKCIKLYSVIIILTIIKTDIFIEVVGIFGYNNNIIIIINGCIKKRSSAVTRASSAFTLSG